MQEQGNDRDILKDGVAGRLVEEAGIVRGDAAPASVVQDVGVGHPVGSGSARVARIRLHHGPPGHDGSSGIDADRDIPQLVGVDAPGIDPQLGKIFRLVPCASDGVGDDDVLGEDAVDRAAVAVGDSIGPRPFEPQELLLTFPPGSGTADDGSDRGNGRFGVTTPPGGSAG